MQIFKYAVERQLKKIFFDSTSMEYAFDNYILGRINCQYALPREYEIRDAFRQAIKRDAHERYTASTLDFDKKLL